MFIAVKVVGSNIVFLGDMGRIATLCTTGVMVYLLLMLALDRRTVISTLDSFKHLLYR
jgi:hypothetical protein